MPTRVRSKSDMNADTCKFRGQGFAFTATKNSTTSHDYVLTENRIIETPQVMFKNHVWGDHFRFQIIVDPNNAFTVPEGFGSIPVGTVLPAGTLLEEFATTWYVNPDLCAQARPDLQYSAEVPAGLAIRIIYTSTGTTNDVECKINFFAHKYLA